MNNKGMTLVELIITFSLLMIIVMGMFNLILDVKIDLDNKQIIKDVTEYSNLINSDIHYDLIKNKPFAIAIKQTSSSAWECSYNSNYSFEEDCKVEGNTLSVDATITNKDDEIRITGSQLVNSLCSDFYPCAVYAYYDTNYPSGTETITAKFKAIAINKKLRVGEGYGIKYGDSFEKIPDPEYLDAKKMKVSMKLDGDFFEMNFPIYITDESTNFGFKISYPFNETNYDIQEPGAA